MHPSVHSCRCDRVSSCPMCGEEYEVCDHGCAGCGRSLDEAIDAHHDRECDNPYDCDACGERVAAATTQRLSRQDADAWRAWARDQEEPEVATAATSIAADSQAASGATKGGT